MRNSDFVVNTLLSCQKPLCDDCLGVLTGIDRHYINKLCRDLASAGTVTRRESRCADCEANKLCSSSSGTAHQHPSAPNKSNTFPPSSANSRTPRKVHSTVLPDDLPKGKSHLYLLSCVSMKLDRAATAKDIYVSPLFLKARYLAEQNGVDWMILSAKHGLLSPGDVIEPYELTLNSMTASQRRDWSQNVMKKLTATLPCYESVTILAGKQYREHITPELHRLGIKVNVPMEHLVRGKQLSWLSKVKEPNLG